MFWALNQLVRRRGKEIETAPSRLGLARVSVIRGDGPLAETACIDDYIRATEPVTDHLTQFRQVIFVISLIQTMLIIHSSARNSCLNVDPRCSCVTPSNQAFFARQTQFIFFEFGWRLQVVLFNVNIDCVEMFSLSTSTYVHLTSTYDFCNLWSAFWQKMVNVQQHLAWKKTSKQNSKNFHLGTVIRIVSVWRLSNHWFTLGRLLCLVHVILKHDVMRCTWLEDLIGMSVLLQWVAARRSRSKHVQASPHYNESSLLEVEISSRHWVCTCWAWLEEGFQNDQSCRAAISGTWTFQKANSSCELEPYSNIWLVLLWETSIMHGRYSIAIHSTWCIHLQYCTWE